jgi:coenzyme F420 hydrogenase subunit beta
MPLKVANQKGQQVAVVGTPCHIDGIAKLKQYPVEGAMLGDIIEYSVSIFCKSNFIYSMIDEVLKEKEGIDLNNVTKFDIKGKNILIYEGDVEKKVPLKEIHDYTRLGCKVCDDFTGRFSDFAVGSVDTPAGFSTVITRTKEAEGIIKEMKKAGLIELKSLSSDDLIITEKLSENKRKSARKAINAIVREELPLPLKFLWE